jgi:hypothetical protein
VICRARGRRAPRSSSRLECSAGLGHNGRVLERGRTAVCCALAVVLGVVASPRGTSLAWSNSTSTVRFVAALVSGTGGAHPSADGRYLYPLPAAPVQPEPCPPPPLPPGPSPRPLGPPKVREDAIPVAGVPPARHVDLSVISGKGIWLTLWPGAKLDVGAVVSLARAAGLRQLWVRTGGRGEGFYGAATLNALIPAAHSAGIAVIAWDFPTLSNPAGDARRAAAALQAADGFGADIESPADGTYLTARRVAYYLSLVRTAAGVKPVAAIVPRPTSYWLATYPYKAEAPFVDVFAPMVYWSCIEPGAAVSSAIAPLAALRPVAPIGQDYDMASEGGRQGLPSGREIWRFLDVARRSGAVGASLYDLESGGRPQLAALSGYPWPAPAPRTHSARSLRRLRT